MLVGVPLYHDFGVFSSISSCISSGKPTLEHVTISCIHSYIDYYLFIVWSPEKQCISTCLNGTQQSLNCPLPLELQCAVQVFSSLTSQTQKPWAWIAFSITH